MAFNNLPVNGWPQIKDLERLDALAKQIEDMPVYTSDDRAFLDTWERDLPILAQDVSDLNTTKANQITIAPTFNEETAYEVGDLVYYNGLSYRCTNAHEGEWDADDFAATTVSNELDALKSGLTDLRNITKNIIIGEYTSFYDALRSFTDGVRYCGLWGINNYTDKPTDATNAESYALLLNVSSAYYYGKILLLCGGNVYLGYFATSTATAITWTKLAVATN